MQVYTGLGEQKYLWPTGSENKTSDSVDRFAARSSDGKAYDFHYFCIT
jgi:hypothetical protein